MSDFHSSVIAGTHSSVGKTTWFLALAQFFKRRGLDVQPFKVGPDYIDPGFHNRVCHPRKSRNLDRFFLTVTTLHALFERHSQGADLTLVEGVMGLFDGRGPCSEEGSTAEMAKLLRLPVFLVIDGAGLARSAAALVKGYQSFDPELDLRGVFINRVGSEGHFRWLQEAVEKETGVAVLGWLPSDARVAIPERHLGLRTAGEEETIEAKVDRLANLLEGRLDEKRFLDLCNGGASPQKSGRRREKIGTVLFSNKKIEPYRRCRIGVAFDRAFSFYYEDNFDLLREAGAELLFFSPLQDPLLPPDLDALYLGGGFPEIYVRELSENESMKASLRVFYEGGGLIYGECGGLIYLTRAFVDTGGREFPLAGLLPGRIRMTERLQNFGYHEVRCRRGTFLFPEGRELRSHEFHYSVWEAGTPQAPILQSPYQIGERFDGFYDGRVLASYQHLHFGQDPDLARNFVRKGKEKRSQASNVKA